MSANKHVVIDAVGKTIKSLPISVAALGDNTVVAAVPGRRIKVIAYSVQATGSVNVKWKDGAATDLTGAFNFAAREGNALAVPAALAWMFATTAGAALLLNLSAAVSVVGFVTYFDDDAS